LPHVCVVCFDCSAKEVVAAIQALGGRGASRQAITKYITDNHGGNVPKGVVGRAIKKCVEHDLIHPTPNHANTFRVSAKAKASPKPKKKAAAAKKTGAAKKKTSTKKKSTKKAASPAAAKSPKAKKAAPAKKSTSAKKSAAGKKGAAKKASTKKSTKKAKKAE